jgi:hypothetical protein
MMELLTIGEWEGYLFLFVLLGIVLLRISTGNIRTRGLIEGRTRRGRDFLSGGRIQLFWVTLALAARYVYQVWQNPTQLPDVPAAWLALLGGSHALYLGTKFQGKRRGRFHI